MELLDEIEKIMEKVNFSGVAYVQEDTGKVIEFANGFADRAEGRKNTIDTRFGIASGCKLFTAVAIVQLVDNDRLSYATRLCECLDIEFPHFDDRVTIHHLLTHTSGIPDYFDEAVMDDFEELWKETPMYLLKKVEDFLPMFQQGEMKFSPGDKFQYNNAGFLVLGLVVEKISGQTFQHYVEKNIFEYCGMNDSGYFSLDQLPKATALGYIDHKDGSWRTNTYSIPIQGGPDGGAYITASDMVRFWTALVENRLVSEKITKALLTPHVKVQAGVSYGYGLWINTSNERVFKYHVMGYDPGVSFHSAYYPNSAVAMVVPSNRSQGASQVMKGIEECLSLK